jgi:hypothetical protein
MVTMNTRGTSPCGCAWVAGASAAGSGAAHSATTAATTDHAITLRTIKRGIVGPTAPARQATGSDNSRANRNGRAPADDRPIDPAPRPSSAAKLRKRLWLAGGALLLFVATLAIGNVFVPADKSVSLATAGQDFVAFYTAGTFVRTGRSADLYELDRVAAFQRDLAARENLQLHADDVAPFWNPPFYAWTFVPLSSLPYRTAWAIWLAVNLTAAAGAMVLLARMLPGDWRTRGLVPLLVVTSLPFIESLGHGQNTCVSLLLVCATISLWRGEQLILAGAACGLLFYKPQLGAILAIALILSRGLKPLAGLAITGTALLAVTLLTLPGTLGAFLHHLPTNLTIMQIDRPYLWDRHVTLKAFWRLLIQGDATGDLWTSTRVLWILTTTLAAACLLATILRTRRSRDDGTTRDRAIAATIVTMPLLMPFYFDYDLLLLAGAAVLVARERAVGGADRVPAKLVTAWVALAGWLVINSGIATLTRVNGTVVLLAVLAAMLIRRAWQPAATVTESDCDDPPAEPLPLAA